MKVWTQMIHACPPGLKLGSKLFFLYTGKGVLTHGQR